MRKIELIKFVKDAAVRYSTKMVDSVENNRHMNELTERLDLTQDQVDAILVDFVNYIAMEQWVDYAMYARDFEVERDGVGRSHLLGESDAKD